MTFNNNSIRSDMSKRVMFSLLMLLILLSCNLGSRRNCDTIGKRFSDISSRLDKASKETNISRENKLRKLKEISEQATRLANDFEGCRIDKKETTLGDQIGQFVDEFRIEKLKEDAGRAYEQFKNEPEGDKSTSAYRIADWQIKSSIRKMEDRLQDLLTTITLDASGSFSIEGQNLYIESIGITDTPDGLVLQCADGNYCFNEHSASSITIPMEQAKAKRVSVYLSDYKQLVACFHNGGHTCGSLVEKYTN